MMTKPTYKCSIYIPYSTYPSSQVTIIFGTAEALTNEAFSTWIKFLLVLQLQEGVVYRDSWFMVLICGEYYGNLQPKKNPLIDIPSLYWILSTLPQCKLMKNDNDNNVPG